MGGTFQKSLAFLPGDVLNYGVVTSGDPVAILNAAAAGSTDPWTDVEGDGEATFAEYLDAKKRVGTRLPK